MLDEEQDTFMALIRTAATEPAVADQVLGILGDQATAVLAAAAIDNPAERGALVAPQTFGFAFVRDVLAAPPLATMCRHEARAWIGRVVARYLTDPDLGPTRASPRPGRQDQQPSAP